MNLAAANHNRGYRLCRALKDMLFPPACLTCNHPPALPSPFCSSCLKELVPLAQPSCMRCGRPWLISEADPYCRPCRREPPAFAQARALGAHDGVLARAIQDFKYNRHWSNGPSLAEFLARQAPTDIFQDNPCLVPVPLHRYRLLRRGFNQSVTLARGLARHYGLELLFRSLIRRRATRPQVGLSWEDRLRNVAGAFSATPGAARQIAQRTVILVDDVFTTGSTVNECAKILRAAGASSVIVLTLTRAYPEASRQG